MLYGKSTMENEFQIKCLWFDESKIYIETQKGEIKRHPLGRVITTGYYTLIKIEDYELDPSSFASKAKPKNLEFLILISVLFGFAKV